MSVVETLVNCICPVAKGMKGRATWFVNMEEFSNKSLRHMSEKGFIEGFLLLFFFFFQRKHSRMFYYCFLKYTPYTNSLVLISGLQWYLLSNKPFWSISLKDPLVSWLKQMKNTFPPPPPPEVNIILQNKFFIFLNLFIKEKSVSFLAFLSFLWGSFPCLYFILFHLFYWMSRSALKIWIHQF